MCVCERERENEREKERQIKRDRERTRERYHNIHWERNRQNITNLNIETRRRYHLEYTCSGEYYPINYASYIETNANIVLINTTTIMSVCFPRLTPFQCSPDMNTTWVTLTSVS